MIVLGILLALLGYWILPLIAPGFPPQLEELFGGLGVLLIVIGLVFWILGSTGRPVGGRRYWY